MDVWVERRGGGVGVAVRWRVDMEWERRSEGGVGVVGAAGKREMDWKWQVERRWEVDIGGSGKEMR